MQLYIATTNPGKLRDFASAAQPIPSIQIQPLPNLSVIPAPPEDAPTFEANARAKALYYASHAPGLLVLADDSGLEVPALDGAPGVRSARYAEDQRFPAAPASTLDERNNAALLRALDGAPDACRHARYRCALALATHNPSDQEPRILLTAEGSLEGLILTTPRGALGFGYDPLFLIPELNQTMAELDAATRLAYSHRARALRTLFAHLAPSLTTDH
ncbi:MAG: non-canonical purine NTP pyrophosphatase [Acidobacteriaceae bacterium]|jgi:XTP/dITP diphosphohydrolase